MNMKVIPLKVQASIAKYESARETLRAFELANARFVEEYGMLRSAYNDAVEAVAEVYRENADTIGNKLGDFSLRQRIEVDPHKLMDLLGPEAVTRGYIKTELAVDRKEYDRGVKSGDIPGDVAQASEKRLPPAVMKPRKSE
jgi:hypothetical protein